MKIIKADIRIYPTAKPPTIKRDFLDLLITLLNTPIDLEYLINLSTLKNFKSLINLVIFSAINAELKIEIDGKIESKSMIAMGENGYRKKDIIDFLSYLIPL